MPKQKDEDIANFKKPTVTPPVNSAGTGNSIINNRPSGLVNFIAQFLVIAVVFFAIGLTLGRRGFEIEQRGIAPNITFENQTPKNQNVDFSLFWEVYKELPDKYFDKSSVDGQKILYGAISGMVRSLDDPYTAFLDPKQNQNIKDELAGSYEGVGIQIGFNKDKKLVVIAPLKGTPAEREGIRAKDQILKVGDKDTFDMTLPEAVDLIRGPAGSKVKLVLLREGEDKTFEKEIERAKISVKSVEVSYIKNSKGRDVAVLAVSRFGDNTDSEWDKAVEEALSKNVAGVIVDMRNNPGGLLSSSIHLASEFIRGTVVKQEDSKGRINSLSVDHEGRMLKMPLAVVVNGGSASASEIFAGAIKDNGRGKVVGEKTFGKGTVQDVVEFAGGSSLHVTIARWLTPDGHSIHEVGIEPDVEVKASEDVPDGLENDPQIKKALEVL